MTYDHSKTKDISDTGGGRHSSEDRGEQGSEEERSDEEWSPRGEIWLPVWVITSPMGGRLLSRRLRATARVGELVEHSVTAVESITTLYLAKAITDEHAEFTIGLFLTDAQYSLAHDEDQSGTYEVLVYDVTTGSAATVQVNPERTDNGRFSVCQHGPRLLWDELEAVYAWWVEYDCTGRASYGLSITPNTQTVWLDQLSNVILKEHTLPARPR